MRMRVCVYFILLFKSMLSYFRVVAAALAFARTLSSQINKLKIKEKKTIP